jgi:hypothetical protein
MLMNKLGPVLHRVMLTIALGIGLGCEPEENQRPTDAANPNSATPTAPAKPSTQALLEGPRRELRLDFLPATISVPESWQLKTTSGEVAVTVLSGPTPHGDAAIRLSRLNSLTPQTVELYLDKMRQDADHSGANLFFEIREQGGMRVVESVRPLRDAAVDWKLRLLVASGLNFDQYELSFLALPRSVYDADSTFLRSLLTSVRVTDAPSTSPGR